MPLKPRVFFDCDDTLLTWNWRLRPHAREVLRQLGDNGCDVYIWSGLGERWDVVRHFGLDPLVRGCFAKPLYRYRERLAELGIPFAPDYVIDDHPAIVAVFGGWHIPAPVEPLSDDHHLLAARDDIARRFGFAPAIGAAHDGTARSLANPSRERGVNAAGRARRRATP